MANRKPKGKKFDLTHAPKLRKTIKETAGKIADMLLEEVDLHRIAV